MKDLSHLTGKRIKLIHMGNDPLTGKPDPIPTGTEGTILKVDYVQGTSVFDMKWDNNRGLNLIDEVDTYEVLN